MATHDEPLLCPFRVVIDTREQRPFAFDGIRADARDKHRPLRIRTYVDTLASGDYSIEGYQSQIACERKSLSDLFGTVGRGRARFERELVRLDAMCFAAVVIEADWLTILKNPPARSKLNPRTVCRSIIAWQQRYCRVHWWACPGRDFAEQLTFRILERFYRVATSAPATGTDDTSERTSD